jgi:hypothetical protein
MVLQVTPAPRIKKKRAKLTPAQKALCHDKLVDLTTDIEAAKENYNDTACKIARKHGRSALFVFKHDTITHKSSPGRSNGLRTNFISA